MRTHITSRIVISALAFFVFPVSAYAASFVPRASPTNLPGTGDFGLLLTQVVNYFIGIVGLIAVLMLVIGAYYYLTSGGDEQKVEKGKQTIVYAIIALVIIAISFALVFTLTNTLRSFGSSDAKPGAGSGGTETSGAPDIPWN